MTLNSGTSPREAIELSRDLSRNADWPLFSDRPAVGHQAALAACTLSWRQPGAIHSDLMSRARRDLERSLAHVAASLGYVVQMFAINTTLQPKSAIAMYRKLWGTQTLRAIPSGITRGPEIEIECGSKVRFAGLASVPLADLAWLVANLDTFQTIVPLLVKTDTAMDEEAVRRLANAALPPTAGSNRFFDLDWPGLAHAIASAGGICVRWSRELSIPELKADLFIDDAQAEALRAALYGAQAGSGMSDDQS